MTAIANNTRHAAHASTLPAVAPEVDHHAVGAMSPPCPKMERLDQDVLISLVKDGTVTISGIPTSATRDGNALISSPEDAKKLTMERAMAAMPHATNTANHTHSQRNTNATLLITPVLNARRTTPQRDALKTEV